MIVPRVQKGNFFLRMKLDTFNVSSLIGGTISSYAPASGNSSSTRLGTIVVGDTIVGLKVGVLKFVTLKSSSVVVLTMEDHETIEL